MDLRRGSGLRQRAVRRVGLAPDRAAREDPSPADPQSPPPLVSLQVLRAVAALSVVVHHAGYDADTLATIRHGAPLALDRVFDWTFGVHLFFVISGFIMLRTARGFGDARGAGRFLLRRLIRVVPLYWLLTSLVILGALVAPGLLNVPLGGAAVMLGSYLFVPVARADGSISPVLGQGWTLDYEMAFYLLFALSMLLPRRRAVPALAATLAGLVILGHRFHPADAALSVWTGELLAEFLFGMALAALVGRGVRLGTAAAAGLALVGAGAAVVLGPLTSAFATTSPVVRLGIPASLVVAASVLGPRWRTGRPILALAALGDASYSLYLSHPFVVRLLRVVWARAAPPAAPLSVFVLMSVVSAVAVSLLLYRGVERPMTQGLQRWAGARAGTAPLLADAALRDG